MRCADLVGLGIWWPLGSGGPWDLVALGIWWPLGSGGRGRRSVRGCEAPPCRAHCHSTYKLVAASTLRATASSREGPRCTWIRPSPFIDERCDEKTVVGARTACHVGELGWARPCARVARNTSIGARGEASRDMLERDSESLRGSSGGGARAGGTTCSCHVLVHEDRAPFGGRRSHHGSGLVIC